MPRTLVIGYGNPARGDDALGPALAAIIEKLELPDVTVESDYQLNVEDAETASRFDAVIFADASLNGPEPFSLEKVKPRVDPTLGSHSVDAKNVIGLAGRLFGAKTGGYELGIRGYEFGHFVEGISEKAADNLKAAAVFLAEILRDGAETIDNALSEFPPEPGKEEK